MIGSWERNRKGWARDVVMQAIVLDHFKLDIGDSGPNFNLGLIENVGIRQIGGFQMVFL